MSSVPRPTSGKRRRILVVCYGNICRSPVAATLLKRTLRARGMQDHFSVGSAGVRALVGHVAAESMQEVAAAHGISLETHRGCQLTLEMAQEADVIIAMDEVVEEEIRILCGEERELLLWPVDDPFGSSPGEFVRAYREIEEFVCRFVDGLAEGAHSS